MKITISTALSLTLIAVGITAFSIHNARQNFSIPLAEGRFMAILIPQEDAVDMFEHRQAVDELHRLLAEGQSEFNFYSIAVATAFVLIGTIAAYLISDQALKPIKSLVEKINDIDESKLTVYIEPPKAKDELSLLTGSFNKMLEKLNLSFEAQKLFAQNAAHELKTPLASMRANIEVLELDKKPTKSDYQEVVGVVKDNTERLIDLVEGLLSFNHSIDEARWQLFNGHFVFEEILSQLSSEIQIKNLTISLLGETQLRGDKTLITRAFFNLVHNAIRYNVEDGKVDITLSNDRITIEDSGVGIPFGHLKHIFQPFYCVDSSRSKELGGHGLGLAITKNIFDKHHIETQVFSKVSKGTKIILSLPKN